MNPLPDATTPLGRAETEALFGAMLDGALDDQQIGPFLLALAERGETAAEIAGAAQAMRSRMIPVAAPSGAIDVCGTGGDGLHTLNVSTAVALVVAACDVPVAKHGNRAGSSLAGAADTLEALGLDLDRAAHSAEATLADLGICFLFAQRHHPALARLAPIRKALGRRTIFNLLGPLCNPAGVTRQLVGIARPDFAPVYAEAMALLGMERAMIVAGEDGMDELTLTGPSRVIDIGGGATSDLRYAPADFGLATAPVEALRGGDARHNAAALRRLLEGETGPYRDAVLMNAAAALMVAERADSPLAAVEEATEAVDRGLANALLNCWIAWK